MSTEKSDILIKYNQYRVAHFKRYQKQNDFSVGHPSPLPYDQHPDGESSSEKEEEYCE